MSDRRPRRGTGSAGPKKHNPHSGRSQYSAGGSTKINTNTKKGK